MLLKEYNHQPKISPLASVSLLLLLLGLSFPPSPAADNLASAAPDNFKLKDIPPEPTTDHEVNNKLNMGPFRLNSYIQISSLKPMKLEASYNEPIDLRRALEYTIQNNLPIRVSKESWNYQRYQLFGNLFNALPIPNFAMGYNLTQSNVEPANTIAASQVFATSVRFPIFQGGGAVYGFLAQLYRDKGWKQAYYTSINDALLSVYQGYNNLVLQHALLQIRAKSLDVSREQLRLNNNLYRSGSGTQFAIMQSRTQLAADQQAMLQAQVTVRQAALTLAYALNLPMSINIVPQQEIISEDSIVDEQLQIDQLLDVALTHRPELRQYELFRLSAARNVQVAAAALYPQVSLFTSYTHSHTSQSRHGRNDGGGGGANGASSTAGAGVFGGLFRTTQQGFNSNWSLSSMGLSTMANIVSARALSRQAELQANQQLLLVTEQVRYDYLSALAAREQIDAAAYGVTSSKEALRLADLRLRSGLGTNLELIQAQRDYINALITQAQAIINSNLSQAQLLHDMGVISIDTLTDGYKYSDESKKGAKGTKF